MGVSKDYIERKHGEPFKFLFLPKMGILGSQASAIKNPIMNYVERFMGKKNLNFLKKIL